MLPSDLEIRYWIGGDGASPFRDWFEGLDPVAAAKVTVALERLRMGNASHVKSLGGGVSELKINFGPGYRVYFGRDGHRLVILLAGGTKQRQRHDIDVAKERWRCHVAP